MTGILIRALSKRYPRSTDLLQLLTQPRSSGSIAALEDIDIHFLPGRIYGIVGPNGAGKTTLLKIAAGLVSPTRGQVHVAGMDIAQHPGVAREQIGYVVADERSFFWRLSVRENMRFFATLQGVERAELEHRIAGCLERVGLLERLESGFGTLSTGMRQQLAIARGLLLDPPILLMDEPTRSLDPEVAQRVRELVRSLVAERPERLVIFSSHNMEEVQDLCSDIVLLRAGRLVSASAQARPPGPLRYLVHTRRPIPRALLESLAGVVPLRLDGLRCELQLERPEVLDLVIDGLRSREIGLVQVTPLSFSLEDLLRGNGGAAK